MEIETIDEITKENLILKIKNLKLITLENKLIILIVEKNLNLRKNLKTEKGLKISPLKNLKKIKLLQIPRNHG